MTNEQAIEDLKKLVDCNVINSTMFNIHHGEALNIAIKALQENEVLKRIQIAKKPVRMHDCIYSKMAEYECGFASGRNFAYCPNCGKKIDWDN